ncbi:hypothetical protein P154DRAFT_521515 [Amniculicola lignicola CBS 123094]|uniref:Uncharacterized protein n=1 Tax=Amniculicola lignicola CBS 123094 TaxID=1392246 RepID=A0A6A5WJA7_9PLEO|nr:hypothetical protein P154DRAFT_521515 [Amniculicola lignicola CBS 123094]
MHSTTPVVIAALAVLGRSNPLPNPYNSIKNFITPRDEINNDVIRFMKCDKLFHVDPAVGGVEDAFAGYWADLNAQGPPNDRAVGGALYDRIEDFFYNGKGVVYGNNFESGVGYTQAHFDHPTSDPAPPMGLYVGSAIMQNAEGKFGFNCFTDDHQDNFKFDDEKYGTCRSYVWCVQKDALDFTAKASSTVRKAEDDSLPIPSKIYSRFHERYDKDKGICDTAPLELEHENPSSEVCSVSWECSNDDRLAGSAIMDTLIAEMQHFGDISQYEENTEKGQYFCNPASGGCSLQPDHTYRTMPDETLVLARAAPPPQSGRAGYRVAYIQTKITCKAQEENDVFCKVIGPLFGLLGLSPALGPASAFAGALIASSCGAAEVSA